MSTKGISELAVMRDVYNKLAALDPAEQSRALQWVIQRLNEDNGRPLTAPTARPMIEVSSNGISTRK